MSSKSAKQRKRAAGAAIVAALATGTLFGGVSPALAKAPPPQVQALVATPAIHDYVGQGGQSNPNDYNGGFADGYHLGAQQGKTDYYSGKSYTPVPAPSGHMTQYDLGKYRGQAEGYGFGYNEAKSLGNIGLYGITHAVVTSGPSATTTAPATAPQQGSTQSTTPSATTTAPATAPQQGGAQSTAPSATTTPPATGPESVSRPQQSGPYSQLTNVPGNPLASPLGKIPGSPLASPLTEFGAPQTTQPTISPGAASAAAGVLGLTPEQAAACGCESGAAASTQSGAAPTDTGTAP
ncbi:hypothetical protein GCM10009753_27880 [Streptantibioticus ferralitis]